MNESSTSCSVSRKYVIVVMSSTPAMAKRLNELATKMSEFPRQPMCKTAFFDKKTKQKRQGEKSVVDTSFFRYCERVNGWFDLLG
jgi:hypothetical protein